MTKIWTQAFDDDEFTEANFLTDIGAHLDVFMLVMAGQSLTGRFPDTHVEVVSAHRPADYFSVGPMFVVSGALRAVIGEFAVHAEFHPLRVVYRGAEYAERPFFFCNILDCVAAFDLAHGEYTFHKKPGFTNRVATITKLAIDESRAAAHDLFRIANGGESIVCVSNGLARRIEEANLTGMRLIEPADWYFGRG